MVRDKNGRFAKGNGGGPGRPSRDREIEYHKILIMVCTPARWEKICKQAVNDAENGDKDARKWIADYLIGPPVQKQEVTGRDGNEIVFKVIRE